MTLFRKLLTVGAIGMAFTAPAAHADYPTKPIKIIVPYGAGGDSDLSTRIWADAMEDELGQPVVVLNKPGAGAVIGTSFVANSRNDGYTLINAGLGNMLVTPNFSKAPYSFDSFEPILKLTSVPLAVVVASDSPYETFDDFKAAASENTLTQGAWGASSSGSILADIIASQSGYTPKLVHAKSSAESMASVVGGHIDSAVSFPPAFGPHVKAGKARALVMNQKMEAYPGVPTFADYGIKGQFEGWAGVFAPKGVPQEVIDRLVEATKKVMVKPEVIQAYKNIGANIDFRYGDKWVEDMRATSKVMKDAAERKKAQ
ncbi:tripartite tricarboxylate transporter substrate binding protein [Vibrio sp. D420a]|uniref:Bug family tripartite tricarboxylate transporter substrate binding protein n=1 Tax=Vibrio sp. D420a TaxID=2836895 RepID=UPI0025578549|nr:tripartite tricarboxylate transporter substrate binding protein [Vibrio sp. D420a]MDK9764683.1 tripartite tricarboxylate transporter substrate binding protein [Vibrio sp. D420a]